MEDLIKKLPFPTHIDFEGQRVAEKIFQIIITGSGIIGFLIGYVMQQFSFTVYTLLLGFALSSLLTLPPWPYLRRHPLKWQKVRTDEGPTSQSGNAKGTNKKKK